jgi:hypothetical protein
VIVAERERLGLAQRFLEFRGEFVESHGASCRAGPGRARRPPLLGRGDWRRFT